MVELEVEQKSVKNSGTKQKDTSSCLTVTQLPETFPVGTIIVLVEALSIFREKKENSLKGQQQMSPRGPRDVRAVALISPRDLCCSARMDLMYWHWQPFCKSSWSSVK